MSVSQTQITHIINFHIQATRQHALTQQTAQIPFKYDSVMSAAGLLPLVSLYARAWNPSPSAVDSALFRDQTAVDLCAATPHLWRAVRACHESISHVRHNDKRGKMFLAL